MPDKPTVRLTEDGSFIIDTALGMLGLTDQQKQVVEAAIPGIQQIVDLVNTDRAMFVQLLALVQQLAPLVAVVQKNLPTLMPAAQVIADALEKQQQGGGDQPVRPPPSE